MCLHTQIHTNIHIHMGFIKVKEIHCSVKFCIFVLHGQWKIQQNILKDFFVSQSVPQKLGAFYPKLQKSQQITSSAILSNSDLFIPGPPHPLRSPSSNLSGLPLGLPSDPLGLQCPPFLMNMTPFPHSHSHDLIPDHLTLGQ